MPEPGEIPEFLTYLDKQRGQSPNTIKAYARDLEAFADFCDRHYGGQWRWDTVDRLGIRGFLGELRRRGLCRRFGACTATCRRTTASPTTSRAPRGCPSSTSGCPPTWTGSRRRRC